MEPSKAAPPPRAPKRVSAEDAEFCHRACHRAACAIQFCLQRASYQESKCVATIDQYFDCCEAAKRASNKQTNST